MNWLAASIVASAVLTVLLDVAIRLWSGVAERDGRRFESWAEASARHSESGRDGPHVYVPWKAMLLASLVLTVLLNVVIRLL